MTIAEVMLITLGSQGAVLDTNKFYLNFDTGAVLQQDANFEEFAPTIAYIYRGKITFNPGIRDDFLLGYNLNDSWSTELETGVIWNSVDTITASSFSGNTSIDLYQIPILVNVVYRVPLTARLNACVGLGAGGVFGVWDSETTGLFGGNIRNTDLDFKFGYQAEAGLKYSLTKQITVGVAYKFFGSLDQGWSLDLSQPPVRNDAIFTINGNYTHAIMATMTWSF